MALRKLAQGMTVDDAGATLVLLESADPNLPPLNGAWSYYAGANGSVTVVGRVIGIAAHATTAGSFTINAGATIPVPAASSIEIQPNAQLVSPTIVFTGTDSYFIEVLN